MGEDVSKFIDPVVGEIEGELFNGVGVSFDIEHVNEVFVELRDGRVVSCETVSGSR